MRILRTTLLVALALASGCYRWVPTEEPIPAGSDVRLHLTTEGSDAVRRVFGPNDGVVSGPLASLDDEGVALLLRTSVSRPGFPPTTLVDTVRVAANQVRRVEIKQMDNKKTTWATLGVLAGTAGLVFLTRTFGGEQETGDPVDPPPDDAVVFKIPLRLFGG